jgi:hypothetical protein
MRRPIAFAFIAGIGCLGIVNSASAACTVPYNLTNGTAADASQVMGNFSAVQNCVDDQAPSGSANAIQYNDGSGGFAGAGPLTDGQLLIGSTGVAPQAAALTAGLNVTITNGPGTITIASTGGGGGGPNPYAAKVPEASSWTTLNGTGMTVTESTAASGLVQALNITSGSLVGGTSPRKVQGLYRAVPSPPYRIVAALSPRVPFVASAVGMSGIGWYDGTKLQLINIYTIGGNTYVGVDAYNSITSLNSNTITPTTSYLITTPGQVTWFGLYDDGTNVHFQTSSDSVNWWDLYSVAKSSGFLGASGYANAVFFTDAIGSAGPVVTSTLLVWDENGLSRTLASVYDN